jgi:hypothetical protein
MLSRLFRAQQARRPWPVDALLPFQSQVQELAGRFPKRSHGQSDYNFHSIAPPSAASSIEAFQHVQSVNRE